MPIIKSAKKAHEASLRKHVFNLRRSRAMKAAVKDVMDLVAEGKTEEAKKKLPIAYKAIDKATKRGVIKSNTADRKKSRLTKFIETSKEKPTKKKK